VERHQITAELSTNPGQFEQSLALHQARTAALDWADEEGVTIAPAPFQRWPSTVGVSWEVTVGRAAAAPADAPFKWCWSVRWRDWLHRFTIMSHAEDHAPTHPTVAGLPG
jgi:hypothetical protein